MSSPGRPGLELGGGWSGSHEGAGSPVLQPVSVRPRALPVPLPAPLSLALSFSPSVALSCFSSFFPHVSQAWGEFDQVLELWLQNILFFGAVFMISCVTSDTG